MKTAFREVQGEAVLKPEAGRLDGLGIALGMVGAALYSLKAVLVKLAYAVEPDLPVSTLMVLRMGLSLPAYLLILLLARKAGEGRIGMRETLLAMCAGVLAYYVCTYLDFWGLKFITAQLERLLLFTYPAFVVLFGALFFGATLTVRGVLAVLLAYVGLAVVFIGGDITESSNLWLGSALVLSCAMLFALFQLIAKRFIDRIGARVFTCLAMIGASTALFLHFLAVNGGVLGAGQALDLPRGVWLVALAMAFFSTLLPSFFINIAIGRIGAQRVAMLGMIGPLATIVAAVVVLGEPFGLWDGVGTTVTLTGIALYTLSRDKPRQT